MPPFSLSEYLRSSGAPPHGLKLLARREQQVRWLTKKGKSATANALAERLRACSPSARCRSGACPICVGKTQLRLAKAIWRQARAEAGEIFTLTVAPASSATPVGGLLSASQLDHNRRLKRALHGASFKWLLGGTDFSLNEHLAGRYSPFWLPHLYAIGSTDGVNIDQLRRKLKGRFPSTDAIPRPVKLQPWDGRWNALFYTVKIEGYRRVGEDDCERFNPETSKLRFCKGTNKQRLRSAERLELALYLDQIGIAQRLFSARAQLHSHGRRIGVCILG